MGMLWTGETPKVESLRLWSLTSTLFKAFCFVAMEEQLVLDLLLLQPDMPLSSKSLIPASDCCRDSVSLYEGSNEKDKKPSIPKLSGAVWEACSNFKKVPGTNVTVIGRGITQVVVSMKDVLREMNEVKPACASASGDDHNSDDEYEDDDLKSSSELSLVLKLLSDIYQELHF